MSDETEGAEGAEETGVDLSSPEVKAAIAEAVEKATGGLKNKNKELLGKVKTAQEAAKAWDGLDPDEVHKTMELFQSSEEAQLLKDGKFEDVIAKRTEKLAKTHEKAVKALKDESTGKDATIDSLKRKIGNLTIDGKLSEALLKAGVNKDGVSLGVRLGHEIWRVDEDGNARPYDAEGDVILGADGVNDLQMDEWVSGRLKEDYPLLWADTRSSGGNAGGSGDATGGKTINRARFDAMPHAEQKKFIASGGKVVDQ